MIEHTKEPWKIGTPPPNGEQTIGTDVGLMVAVATTGAGINAEANARRIVACVNYCKGLPTEGIITATALGKTAEVSLQQLVDAIAERDQLLAALDGMVAMWKTTCDAMEWEPDHLAEYDIARSAIAAVKGE